MSPFNSPIRFKIPEAAQHGLYRLYAVLFYGYLYISYCKHIEIRILCQGIKIYKEFKDIFFYNKKVCK